MTPVNTILVDRSIILFLYKISFRKKQQEFPKKIKKNMSDLCVDNYNPKKENSMSFSFPIVSTRRHICQNPS